MAIMAFFGEPWGPVESVTLLDRWKLCLMRIGTSFYSGELNPSAFFDVAIYHDGRDSVACFSRRHCYWYRNSGASEVSAIESWCLNFRVVFYSYCIEVRESFNAGWGLGSDFKWS